MAITREIRFSRSYENPRGTGTPIYIYIYRNDRGTYLLSPMAPKRNIGHPQSPAIHCNLGLV